MNYLLPERLERLAREYVLGTLTGGARRRFEQVLRQSRAAHVAVSVWQERFSVLAAGVPPMQPREAVWQGLESRLFAAAESESARPGVLRWLGDLLSGKALAGVLAGVLMCAVVLRMQPQLVGLEAQQEALPASYVGLLLDSTGRPTVLASSKRHGKQMTIKLLQPVKVPAGQVAQLWAFPKDAAPFVVATLPALPDKGNVTMPLPDTSEKLFSSVGRLAISIDATPRKPGDPVPTDFTLSGHCVKMW